ncbi:MAG: hypothetical protein J5727_10415 [Kiritimatiellae bacterium]|nr:hypothetical protein [Kiritimatiellia bacterium]
MKKPLLTIATIAAAITLLDAGTYTWTGAAGDGLWFTAGNWNYDGVPAANSPGNAPSDDVVIANGDTVTYVPGGDWVPTGSITISGSSTLVQSTGDAWPNVLGPLVLDGGTYDTGSAGNFRLGSTLTVRNGGALILRCTQGNTDGNGLIVLENGGTINRTGEWTGTIPVEFNGGEMTVAGVFTSNAGDIYNGGAIVATGEFHPLDKLAVTGTVITCSLYAPQGADRVATFAGGGLVCTSASFDGFYQNAGVYIDIPSNSMAAFTMPVAASSVYSAYFSNGKFRFAGETVSVEDFESIINVQTVDGSHSRFSLARATDWKLGALSATSVSASAATVSTVVEATGDGAFTVYVACDTDTITEGNVIAKGEAVTESNGVYYKTFSPLDENTAYNYAFAIVTNGAVAAFKSASFVASDYEYIYMDGAWLNGAAANLGKNATAEGGPDSALIVGTLTVTGQEICPSKKKLKDAVVSANTIVLGEAADFPTAAMELCNSVYVNNKVADLVGPAPYGVYACPRAMNFTSASGNGVVKRGDAYTCYATEEQCAAVYANLFANEKIRLNGAAVDEDAFRASFTTNAVDTDKTIAVNEETVPLKQLTITYWEPVWTGVPKADWTVQPGARVKLTKDTRIGALTVADSTDVKIDLNGYNLKVVSLTVDGEKKRGEFTKDTLSILTGEGSLTVSGPGFAIIIR